MISEKNHICFMFNLPWVWVSLYDFLAVFSPPVTIIKNVDITCCLHDNSRLSHCLASIVTIPTVCFTFSFPENTQTFLLKSVQKRMEILAGWWWYVPSLGFRLTPTILIFSANNRWASLKLIVSKRTRSSIIILLDCKGISVMEATIGIRLIMVI